MARGQSIRIFLADGTVTGIRHAEVVNWTGQAIACPRSRLGELHSWDEAHRPGVYLLFGFDEESGAAAVYIGEAENVFVRLQDHLSKKDFWNEVVIFTNKDENLTKAHARYLESKLVAATARSRRYALTNSSQPQGSALPRGDRDAMESFLDQIRVLLGVLGHRVLEPITGTAEEAPQSSFQRVPIESGPTAGSTSGTEFHLSIKGIAARAVQTDEGLVVRAGSGAASKVSDSLSAGYRKIRDQLVQQGTLIQSGNQFSFAADALFASPSAAAAVIVGYPINGRDVWKTQAGVSLGHIEKVAAEQG